MFRIALPVIFIIGSIAGFIFFVNPTFQKAKIDNIRLTRIEDALKKANQLKDLRDKLGLKRNSIPEGDLVRIARMVPDSVENIGLIIELNNIAKSKGMEVLNPAIGPSVGAGSPSTANASVNTGIDIGPDGNKYGSLTMSFSVSTTYEKFLGFMQELEKSLRLVDVKEVAFSAPDAKTGKSLYNITIDTYWLK